MRLLVGLGNPGPNYARNRHNIGFMAVEAIARRHAFGAWRRRFDGLCAEGTLAGEKVLALKPRTYMNDSGRAVGQAVRFFKLAAAEVVVVHDDVDLAPGKIRVKTGGGNAGHNGLRDIDAHIGPDYMRVRIGVGHPGERDRVRGHVLDDFAKADAEWLGPLLDAVAEAAPLLVSHGGARFTTKVALILNPPPPKPSPQGSGETGPGNPDGEAG